MRRPHPVLATDAIVSKWTDLEPQIVKIVEGTDCAAIQLLRRGKDGEADRNAITVEDSGPQDY